MTITIELPDDAMRALQADAGAQGRPVEKVAAEHLAALYTAYDAEAAAVAEALEQLEAGRGRSLAAFSQEFSAFAIAGPGQRGVAGVNSGE